MGIKRKYDPKRWEMVSVSPLDKELIALRQCVSARWNESEPWVCCFHTIFDSIATDKAHPSAPSGGTLGRLARERNCEVLATKTPRLVLSKSAWYFLTPRSGRVELLLYIWGHPWKACPREKLRGFGNEDAEIALSKSALYFLTPGGGRVELPLYTCYNFLFHFFFRLQSCRPRKCHWLCTRATLPFRPSNFGSTKKPSLFYGLLAS